MQHPQPDPQAITPAAAELRTRRFISIISSSIRALASLIGESPAFVAEAVYRAEKDPASPHEDCTTLTAFSSTTPPQHPPLIYPNSNWHFPGSEWAPSQRTQRDPENRAFWWTKERAKDSQGHVWSRELKLTTDNYGTLVEVPA